MITTLKKFLLAGITGMLFSCNEGVPKVSGDPMTTTVDSIDVDQQAIDSLIEVHFAIKDWKKDKKFSIDHYADNGKTIAFKGQLKDIFKEDNKSFLLITDARGRKRNYYLSVSLTDEQLLTIQQTLASGTKLSSGTFIVSNWRVMEGAPIISKSDQDDPFTIETNKVQGDLVDYYLYSRD